MLSAVIKSKRFNSYIFMLINTLVWGAALIIVKPAFDVTTPFRFLLYRFALASIVALPILIYYIRKKKVSWKTFFTVSAIEMIGTTLNLGILYIGVQRTSAIEASLISTTAPLFVILMGILFLKEKQEKKEWLGFVFSFAGMILLTLLPILTNGAVSHSASLFGNLLIIGANLAESSYFITAKRSYSKLPKFLIASISFLVGVVSFSILSLWEINWSTS